MFRSQAGRNMSLRGQAENPCLPDHEAGKVDSLFCYRTGQAVFDVDDAMAREIYADNPVLPRFYKSYADLVYFRLSAATLDYYDLTPGKSHWQDGRGLDRLLCYHRGKEYASLFGYEYQGDN